MLPISAPKLLIEPTSSTSGAVEPVKLMVWLLSKVPLTSTASVPPVLPLPTTQAPDGPAVPCVISGVIRL